MLNKSRLYFIAIILLLVNLFYRLIDQSQMIWHFPLDYTNDLSSYMAQLYFMDVCGYHNFCPYWYNGIEAFLFTPPGWFFFGLLLYKIVGSITLATYLSIIFSFISAFLLVYFLYRKLGLNQFQVIVFFTLLFANAQVIGSFIRLGRVHEFFGWIWFLLFAFIIFWYKDHDFDKKFYFIIIPWGAMLLIYPSVFILASAFLLGLFLIKGFRDKLKIILLGLITALVTSFWWWDFVNKATEGSVLEWQQGKWLWQFRLDLLVTNLAALFIPLLLLILFYFYYKQKKSDLLFFLPVLILAFLYLFRLVGFIPLFNNIFQDPYLFFFLFFAVYLFVNIDFTKFSFGRLIPILFLLVALISLSISIFYTPFFTVTDDPITNEVVSFLPEINGNYHHLGIFSRNFYPNALVSFSAIKYNLTTAYGWYPEYIPFSEQKKFIELEESFQKKDCNTMNELLLHFKVEEVIVSGPCEFVESCGLKIKKQGQYSCLATVQ